MEFRIADTFTDSLSRLNGEEQKAVKTAAFDLQLNPAGPGFSFHKLDKAKDKNFWSVRVSRDIRLIVHKTRDSFLLCYVGHHDQAYQWAERRKLETHPKTGAAQLVEIRERVQEILVPVYVETPRQTAAKKPLFETVSDDVLLGYGVPPEWLSDVRRATEDTLLSLADHLPSEAAEALLELATGGKPEPSPSVTAVTNPFDHPDAQRRFRVMGDTEELERALEYPWEKWIVFLHPAQRQLVEREYTGPARVAGSAGTGKTIVALHRAVFLARKHPDARILLTTFSDSLANALGDRLKRLISNEPRLAERIEVRSIDAIGVRLFKYHFGEPKLASREVISDFLQKIAGEVANHSFGRHFLLTEWEQVVDAWQLETWESYRDVARLGRKIKLPERQRAVLWSIFERLRERLTDTGLITNATLFTRLASHFVAKKVRPYDFAIVDEAQDLTVPHFRFLAALGAARPDSLFFAGDLGQRIFQQPFSWRALGVDIRGRSRILRVNYRTSHQIRVQADRLLAPELSDFDGNTESREHTISVFNGPAPTIRVLENQQQEIDAVKTWLLDRIKEGVTPHETGVFVRSPAQLERARAAIRQCELPFNVLDDSAEIVRGHVSIGTMHLAKGLEFRSVVIMACDDEIIPLQERIETVTEDSDLEEVYNTERHLLYVACTRARDHMLVTGVDPSSEFLADLKI
jgi:mRNA-degrading endonuclease RelE of RelBE toxin-antitoxin system